jgi:hydrogenase maturation protease
VNAYRAPGFPPPRVLVLGIGNLLMGDEGVGVHAIRTLEGAGLPEDVTIIDGGTGGFHLLSYFSDYDPLILIDATMDGQPAGTVSVLEPRRASDFPRALTAHDIGLRDLIEAAVLTGPLPRIWLVTVSIPEMQPMQARLSPALADSLPAVVERVVGLVARACARAGGRTAI